ncbi:DMT family transporter [Actinoplanes sp. NPDC049265]|uniref:EamA family transporter n=1 Tax=Actinoplanes sp. NPDC049265 TaxID=3363902 RepID=UPI00371FE942
MRTAGGIATMVASAASNQTGAAIGAHAFPAIGPAGVVAVRQIVAAIVLLPLARPDLRRMRWSQWWPVLLLGLVFAIMNLSLYTAVDRIGLGLAVTLEVLGPLAVALLGSRTRMDLICALLAGLGVWVLVRPGPSSDWIGIGLGLLAAGCWASYIMLNRVAGRRFDGIEAPALGSAVAALLNLPVFVLLMPMSPAALLFAGTAGILSSVLPYTADLIALRHVPARFFGLFMSVHPVMAAVAGLILLGQPLAGHELAGMAIVITVNAVSVALTAARRSAETPGRADAARRSRPLRGLVNASTSTD